MAEQVARQRAISGAGKDGIEIARQLVPAVFQRGNRKASHVAGEPKGVIEPKLEPHADQIAAMFG